MKEGMNGIHRIFFITLFSYKGGDVVDGKTGANGKNSPKKDDKTMKILVNTLAEYNRTPGIIFKYFDMKRKWFLALME